MAAEGQFLASAVVVPEADSSEPTLSLGKRRQSSEPESGIKRQRIGSEQPNTSSRDNDFPADGREASRKRIRDEERQRGRRLFGGLVGALSQPQSTSSLQRKRAEIEKRGQLKLRQQTQEDIQHDQQQFEKIKAMRVKEQIKVDEETMRIRHANMLAAAHSLQTDTEPPLYYRPWKLLPEQELRIDEQIHRTNELIRIEVEEFGKRKAERETHAALESNNEAHTTPDLPDHQAAVGPGNSPMVIDTESKVSLENEQDGHTNSQDVATVTNTGKNGHNVLNKTDVATEPKPMEEKDDDPDDHGEVIHEAEDTVIY